MAEMGILDLIVELDLKHTESDLDRLTGALKKVKEAVGNGIKLTNVTNQLQKICHVIDDEISGSTITKLGQFADQLAKLKGFENTHINIKINNQVSGTMDRIQEDMQNIRELGNDFEFAEKKVEAFYQSANRMGEIFQSASFGGGFEQFRQMLDILLQKRGMALGAGTQLSRDVETGWTTWKEGAIEVEGTVSEASDAFERLGDGMVRYLTDGKEAVDNVNNALVGVKENIGDIIPDLKNIVEAGAFKSWMYGPQLPGGNREANVSASTEKYAANLKEVATQSSMDAEEKLESIKRTFANSSEAVQKCIANLYKFDVSEFNRFKNAMGETVTVLKSVETAASESVNRDYGQELVDNLVGNYSEIELMTMKMNGMKQALADDIDANRVDSQQIAERTMRIQELNSRIEELKQKEEEATSKTKGLVDSLKELLSTGKKDFFGRLISQFARIAKYRFIRTVLKQITEGFREGVENVYNYSKAIGSSFAPSMDSAASSLLQMKNSIGAAAAPLIQSLIPVLQVAVNWFITLVNYANQFIALLRGQTTWTRAVPATTTAFGKQEKAAKGAGAAIKDLLADWDELNIIQSQSGGGGGGGATSAAEDYLNMFEEVGTFDNRIKSIVGFITDNFNTIKQVALAIGAALLAWKIGNGVAEVLNLVNTLRGGVIMAAIGFTLLSIAGHSIGSEGFNLANVLESIGGIVASLFGGSWIGAAAAKALGFTASSGALLGAVTGLAIGLMVWTYSIHCGIIDSAYGTLTEDIETIRKNIEDNYMTKDAKMKIEVTKASIASTADAEKKVQLAVDKLKDTYPVSIKLQSKDDAENLLAMVNDIVSSTNALADDRKEKIKVPITTSGQFDNPSELINFTNEEWTKIQEHVKGLGDDIGKMIANGITEGADLDDLKNKLIKMANAVTYGLKSGEFAGKVGLAGSESRQNLRNGLYTKGTVENYINEYRKYTDEIRKEAEAAAVAEQSQFGALMAAAKEMYEQTGSQEDYESYVKAKELYEIFDVADRAAQLFSEWTADGAKLFADDIVAALGVAMKNNANYHDRRGILERQLEQIANTGTMDHVSDDIVDQYVENIKTNMILAISNETGFGEEFIRKLIGDYNLNPADFFDAEYIEKLKGSLMDTLGRSKLTDQQKQRVMAAFGFNADDWTEEERKIIAGMVQEAKGNGSNVIEVPVELDPTDRTEVPDAIKDYYKTIEEEVKPVEVPVGFKPAFKDDPEGALMDGIKHWVPADKIEDILGDKKDKKGFGGVNPQEFIPKEEIVERAKETVEECKGVFGELWDSIANWFGEQVTPAPGSIEPEEWQQYVYPGSNYAPPTQTNTQPLANPTDLTVEDLSGDVAKGTKEANVTLAAMIQSAIATATRELMHRPVQVTLNASTGLGRTTASSGRLMENVTGITFLPG